jgi:SPP1 gp7 family putative phage head morphogenesis protein
MARGKGDEQKRAATHGPHHSFGPMPVHEVAPGRWRWGRSGKTYRTKAAAERQARAIYAAGWKEDGSPRPKKRAELHRALSPPRRAEGRYVRDLVSVMQRVHEGVFEVVRREWPAPESRRDKDEDAFGLPFRSRLFKYIDREVGKAHDRMSDEVEEKGGAAARALGISPKAAGLGGIVAGARAANVDLIQNAAVSFVDDVRKVLDESDGLRHEEIAKLLEERAGVSRRRAELIARDQTAKLAGALNHARQKAAGITAFTWSTANDERVRESHAELEGEQFDYDDPPEVDGEPTLPTEAVNCRCVAIPVIDFGAEDDEADE